MSRTLMTIAAVGLGVAVVLIGAAGILNEGYGNIPGLAPDDAPPGKPQTRDFAWDGGDSITIDAPAATVHLVPGKTPHVTIRGPARMLERVRLHDGTLDLSDSSSFPDSAPLFFWNHDDRIDVTLSGMMLRDISLDGGGKLMLGQIDQDRLAIRISGAGEAEAEGRVDNLEVTVSGTGDVRLGKLAAKIANVTISGVGNAEIRPSDEAEVTLSGVGNVHLLTQPKKLRKHISGVGHVEGPDGGTDSKDD